MSGPARAAGNPTHHDANILTCSSENRIEEAFADLREILGQVSSVISWRTRALSESGGESVPALGERLHALYAEARETMWGR